MEFRRVLFRSCRDRQVALRQAPGAGPVHLSLRERRQGLPDAGPAGLSAGRDRLAQPAAQLASGQRRIGRRFPGDGCVLRRPGAPICDSMVVMDVAPQPAVPPAPADVAALQAALAAAEARADLAEAELARSEEHTAELQSLMRISYAVLFLKTTTETTMH